MVATICVHALVPVGSPLARTNGSPFSAATLEVSTAPSRKSVLSSDAPAEDGSIDEASGADGAAAAIVLNSPRSFTGTGSRLRPLDRGIDVPSSSDLRLAEARAPPLF